MSKTKFLILGRGISGAVLSFKLMERGIAHDLVDEPALSSSSKIAAGLLNPLVLKRMRLVQGAVEFMNSAPGFYQSLEKRTGTRFYYPTPIAHRFASPGAVNEWMEKSTLPLYDQLLGEVSNQKYPLLPAPYGTGILKTCGWLDTERFLDVHRSAHPSFGKLINRAISRTELETLTANYDHTVVCNGHLITRLFPEIDLLRPTRGEVLTIHTDDIPGDTIIHGKVFIMPLGQKRFKVGASYHWDKLNDTATPDGLRQLREGLEKLFKGHYTIISHRAGVRPNVKDRKPLLGSMPDGEIHCFNGMGSRAVLMTPFLADVLLDHILIRRDIPAEYRISRFYK